MRTCAPRRRARTPRAGASRCTSQRSTPAMPGRRPASVRSGGSLRSAAATATIAWSRGRGSRRTAWRRTSR
eukprot:5131239-Lingulodinium_polyedra.AAC.1